MTREEAIEELKINLREGFGSPKIWRPAIEMAISSLEAQPRMIDGEELLKRLEAMKQEETEHIVSYGGIPDLCETVNILDAIAKFVMGKLATNTVIADIAANKEG